LPLLAARLAAEALAETSLSPAQRVGCIQVLVPMATSNATALDTVLARLLLAARPSDPATLDHLSGLLVEDSLPSDANLPRIRPLPARSLLSLEQRFLS